jgi:hypothetical protein
LAKKIGLLDTNPSLPRKKLQRVTTSGAYASRKELIKEAVEVYETEPADEEPPKKIELTVAINNKEVEQAFSCQCTVPEVSSLVGVTIEELREWSLKFYRLPIETVKDQYGKRGIAQLRILIFKKVLEGDVDYHKVYGKKILEDIDEQNNGADETGMVTIYEMQLPNNNR